MRSLSLCRLILSICLTLLPVLWIAGCGDDDGSASDGDVETVEVARSSLARDLSPDAGLSEVKTLAAGNTDFAMDLFQELGNPDRNLFFSPYSISLALTMAYAGAEGGTGSEMADVLHYRLPEDALHAAFNRLDLILEDRQIGSTADSTPLPVLYTANALWVRKGRRFLPEYLDTLALHYGAGVHLTDFESSPEAARGAINRWVSDNTEGLIQELLGSGTLSSLTRLVLTNAIYFQGYWHLPFDPESTRDAPFFLSSGGQTKVRLMTRKETYGYTEGTDYQAVELPFAGEALSMVVLLPAPGRQLSFEQELTGGQLTGICEALTPQLVRVYLPRFAMEPQAIRLDDALARMGMGTAFTEAADFSGMDGAEDLFISNVTHKTFVSVDEYGVEAGAATGVVVGPTSGNPLFTVRADRSFLFLIRDKETRAVLFMGRMADPND